MTWLARFTLFPGTDGGSLPFTVLATVAANG